MDLSFLTQLWDSDFPAMPPKLKQQNPRVFEQTSEPAADFSAMLALMGGLAPGCCVQNPAEVAKNDPLESQSAASVEAVSLCESSSQVVSVSSVEEFAVDASAVLDGHQAASAEIKEAVEVFKEAESGMLQSVSNLRQISNDADFLSADEHLAMHSDAPSGDRSGFMTVQPKEQDSASVYERLTDHLPLTEQRSNQLTFQSEAGDFKNSLETEKAALKNETKSQTLSNQEVDGIAVDSRERVADRRVDAPASGILNAAELSEGDNHLRKTTSPGITFVKYEAPERFGFIFKDQAQFLSEEKFSTVVKPDHFDAHSYQSFGKADESSLLVKGELNEDKATAGLFWADPALRSGSKEVFNLLQDGSSYVQDRRPAENFELTSQITVKEDLAQEKQEGDVEMAGEKGSTFQLQFKQLVISTDSSEAEVSQFAQSGASKGQRSREARNSGEISSEALRADGNRSKSVVLEDEGLLEPVEDAKEESGFVTVEDKKMIPTADLPSSVLAKGEVTGEEEVLDLTNSELPQGVASQWLYEENGAANETEKMRDKQLISSVTPKDHVSRESKEPTSETVSFDGSISETLHLAKEDFDHESSSSDSSVAKRHDSAMEGSPLEKPESQCQPLKEKNENKVVQQAFDTLPKGLADAIRQEFPTSLKTQGQHFSGKQATDATSMNQLNEAFLEQKSSSTMRLAELPLKFAIDVRGGELLLTIMTNSDKDSNHLRQHSNYIRQRLAKKGYEFDAVDVVNMAQETEGGYKVYQYDMVV